MLRPKGYGCARMSSPNNNRMSTTFKNFIAGAWVEPSTGEFFENRNPADWNDLVGRFPKSGSDEVRRAAASARRGFAHWSRTPAPARGQVLQRVGDLLVRQKEPLARAMTREMGKVLLEAGGDAQGGLGHPDFGDPEGRRRC